MSFGAAVSRLAEQTPAQRNRVVDLMRAGSILVVMLGHWTLAAVTVQDGRLDAGNILESATWTHPLTWFFQVMPVFFLVGGYVNGLSWRSAQGRGTPYGAWLRGRARRLVLPVVPVLLLWSVAGWWALQAGMGLGRLRLASSVALMPTWFLACYVLVVALAPVGLRLWDRWGWGSVLAGVLLAAAVDVLSLTLGNVSVGFVNYLVVWGTVHQVGYAWLDDRLASTRSRLLTALVGLAGAVTLVTVGPYPVSMVGVSTATVNNTYPPRVTLVFLGLLQGGLLLLLEPAARRLVRQRRVWWLVVAVNARIMTLYLWHVTAMVAVIGTSLLLGGVGLGVEPLTATWWLTRPFWYAVLAAVTLGLVACFGRFETPGADPRPAPPPWRPLLAVAGACAGLAALAVLGIADQTGLRWGLLLLPVVSVYVGGVARLPGR
jgi:surface polysaccharide O-acyltransferase-like enzyme